MAVRCAENLAQGGTEWPACDPVLSPSPRPAAPDGRYAQRAGSDVGTMGLERDGPGSPTRWQHLTVAAAQAMRTPGRLTLGAPVAHGGPLPH